MNSGIKNIFITRRRTFLLLITIAFLFFSWAGFVFTPMTGDIKVFLASSNQSNYISKELFVGAFKAWELKSVFSRTLMYLIYKIACLFTSFGTHSFEVTCKFVYSVIILACSYLSMYFLFGANKRKLYFYSPATASLFFAVHNTCQMQVEMTTAILVLLAYSLYINAIKTDKKTIAKLLSSGALIGSVFFFKSILLALSVSVVAAVSIYLIEKKQNLSIKRMMIVASGSIIMLIVILLLIMIINPGEIQDIINASYFQKSVFDYNISLKPFIKMIVKTSWSRIQFIPVVFAGFFALLFNLIFIMFHYENKKIQGIFFHAVMWIMPALFVVISYRFFVYHYAAFIFPGLVEIFYAVKSCRALKKKEWKVNYAAIGLSVSVLFFAVWYVVYYSVLSSSFSVYYRENLQTYEMTDNALSKINFDRKETVLYLDDGKGAYYLGNPSYMKYYFPLPLQRLPEDSKLLCHTESYDAVMNYDGKYISLYEEWFFYDDRYQELREYICNEYEPVASYCAFTPPFSIDQNQDGITLTFKLFQKKNLL